MWFLFVPVCIALPFAAIAFARARRFRRRERGMVFAEVRDFARRAEDPVLFAEMRFTAPLRSDDDRTHDTIFIVRHGPHSLAFILDTSRARIRWWVLAEWFASDGSRTARFETTFIESAIPTREIQILLKAARGETSPPPAPEPALEVHVDPFEPPASDPSAPAVQA